MSHQTSFIIFLIGCLAVARAMESFEPEVVPGGDELDAMFRQLAKRNIFADFEYRVENLAHKLGGKIHQMGGKLHNFALHLKDCTVKQRPAFNGVVGMELKAALSCVNDLFLKADNLVGVVITAVHLSNLQLTALRLGGCMAVKNYPLAKKVLGGIATCMKH